ncbi:MAG TPA: undecaprenyl-diphosphate phosphatase [Candidatus Wirthbacteria bacterium]|nr:undecaprenyl-diphosphate phosphatase [Candidatus Wirthbacteria bacterium]
MNHLRVAFLGLVQGVTEFLPVSSSGHLVFFSRLFRWYRLDMTLDIILHAGTLVAVLVYFWPDLAGMVKAFWGKSKSLGQHKQRRLVWYIILGNLPAGLTGLFCQSKLENYFVSGFWYILFWILMALLYLLSSRFQESTQNSQDLRLWQVVLIGVCQAVALLPGVSRSGITILAGLLVGLSREQAARFSFLLGIPVIMGASSLTFFRIGINGLDLQMALLYLNGFVVSAVVGFISIKFLLTYLSRRSLSAFGIYLLFVSMIALLGGL